MSQTISRRAFSIGLLAAGLAGPARAFAPEASLRPRLRPGDAAVRTTPSADALIERAGLGGKVAFAVADAQTGLVLEARNPVLGLPPASVTKAITALYAMDALGAGHRFHTDLVATGPVENGVVKGDLVLVGGGDPTLDTDALAEMASKLKAAGIHSVSGAFLVHGGALPQLDEIDPTQMVHHSYNPAISGLNLNFNRVHFQWVKATGGGWNVMMDARSRNHRPDVRVARMRIEQRDSPVFSYRKLGDIDEWSVASGALGNGGSRWLPVRNPALYAGEVFAGFARSHGIVLKAAKVVGVVPGGTVLVRHSSQELRTILRAMMKYSTNLTAEVVGLAATRARGHSVTDLAGSARYMNAWAAASLGMRRASFADHSGLGEGSRVSAADMVAGLVAARAATELPELMKLVSMKDKSGDLPVTVRAKTGTLNFVSALAGFVNAKDGTELAFAIFAADTDRRARNVGVEQPSGLRRWLNASHGLQRQLIGRWTVLYTT